MGLYGCFKVKDPVVFPEASSARDETIHSNSVFSIESLKPLGLFVCMSGIVFFEASSARDETIRSKSVFSIWKVEILRSDCLHEWYY